MRARRGLGWLLPSISGVIPSVNEHDPIPVGKQPCDLPLVKAKLRAALIAGERSGPARLFDPVAFLQRMYSQRK